MTTEMTQLVWFNVSVIYSAGTASYAANIGPGVARVVLVFLAVHGALWAIYRAMSLARMEGSKSNAE